MRFALGFMLGIVGLFAGIVGPAAAQTSPRMAPDEVYQLFAAGGFPVKNKRPVNRCGQVANPKVAFTDLNGDGVKEAIFIDKDPCYGAALFWTSIAAKDTKGRWRPILSAAGIATVGDTVTGGWVDIDLKDRATTTVMHFDGSRYVGTVAPQAGQPMSRFGGKPTQAQADAVRKALASESADALGSGGEDMAFGVGTVDLNDDGRDDLLVQLHDPGHCGPKGCAGYVLLATPGGYSGHAIGLPLFSGKVSVLASTHNGMHDLRFDDAGHVFRWDGREYR